MFGRPTGEVMIAQVPTESAVVEEETTLEQMEKEISVTKEEPEQLAFTPGKPVIKMMPQAEFVNQKAPIFSSFIITKEFSQAILIILLSALLIDSVFILRAEKIRIAGKSFIHFSFFAIIFFSILLSQQGQIF
jgi:hypothetical protein